MKKIRPRTPRAKSTAQARRAESVTGMDASLSRPATPVHSAEIAAGTTPERYAVCAAGGRMDAPESKSLPENAYRQLAPGETYRPVVPASASLPEATTRSVFWGLFLCAIFTAASAYSGLK